MQYIRTVTYPSGIPAEHILPDAKEYGMAGHSEPVWP